MTYVYVTKLYKRRETFRLVWPPLAKVILDVTDRDSEGLSSQPNKVQVKPCCTEPSYTLRKRYVRFVDNRLTTTDEEMIECDLVDRRRSFSLRKVED